jgi:hypothetical protein
MIYYNKIIQVVGRPNVMKTQALVSFKKYMIATIQSGVTLEGKC